VIIIIIIIIAQGILLLLMTIDKDFVIFIKLLQKEHRKLILFYLCSSFQDAFFHKVMSESISIFITFGCRLVGDHYNG
jgi:hypothetical protein